MGFHWIYPFLQEEGCSRSTPGKSCVSREEDHDEIELSHRRFKTVKDICVMAVFGKGYKPVGQKKWDLMTIIRLVPFSCKDSRYGIMKQRLRVTNRRKTGTPTGAMSYSRWF